MARAQKIMVGSIEEDYNTARQHLGLLQEALDRQKAEAERARRKTRSVPHP